jgi:hypothetical protein
MESVMLTGAGIQSGNQGRAMLRSSPRYRRAAAEYLKAFVEEMNASGFVARSIARHGVQGLSAVK